MKSLQQGERLVNGGSMRTYSSKPFFCMTSWIVCVANISCYGMPSQSPLVVAGRSMIGYILLCLCRFLWHPDTIYQHVLLTARGAQSILYATHWQVCTIVACSLEGCTIVTVFLTSLLCLDVACCRLTVSACGKHNLLMCGVCNVLLNAEWCSTVWAGKFCEMCCWKQFWSQAIGVHTYKYLLSFLGVLLLCSLLHSCLQHFCAVLEWLECLCLVFTVLYAAWSSFTAWSWSHSPVLTAVGLRPLSWLNAFGG